MKKIVLASTSFRRQELLRWTGVPFEIVAPNFEELPYNSKKTPSIQAYMITLSLGKALSVSDQFPDSIILSGDTMMQLGDELIGKPKDLDDARVILHKFSGATHKALTAVSIIDTSANKSMSDIVETKVLFKKLSDEQIEKYVQTSEPLGKAGAYAINHGAKAFVDHVEGSMTNVIGFPLVRVCELLAEFGVTIPVDIHQIIKKHLGVDS